MQDSQYQTNSQGHFDSGACLAFLESVVPDSGTKFVTEWVSKPNHVNGGSMVHHPVANHAELVAKALEADSRGNNVYFAMASYKGVIYKKTANGFEYPAGRTQGNALDVKCLWQDWDVGKANEANSYATRDEAKAALKSYLSSTGLPIPIIVSSGYGIHTYWVFTEAVSADEWESIARLQRVIMRHLGVKFDPSRDKDCASVLRVPGTHNFKPGKEPKLVKLLKDDAAPLPAHEYKRLLLKCIEDNNLVVVEQQVAFSGAAPNFAPGSTGNLDAFERVEHRPSDANLVADQCQQVRHFRETGCSDSEPLWYSCIGVVKHTTDGEKHIHAWSTTDGRYDRDQTQAKIDQWKVGPTTCEGFRELNPEGCAGCEKTCKSPIQLGVVAYPAQLNRQAEMNAQYAWIEKDAGIYRRLYRDFIPMDKFHAAHANQTIEITVGKTNKDISVSRLWLTDKGRSQFKAIVTRPGEPAVTADNCLNDWAGFSCEPVPGGVEPFEKLYTYLFGDQRFPLLWLAHLIQFPGIKMFVALVVWSLHEGVGKNLLFETIGALFSPHHFALIGQSEVDDDFCGWIPGTVFMLGDEIRASKSEKSRDRLKLWGTATTLRTHDKGQPKRVVDNLMNQVYLSNHADGMFLSDHDRRFYVHEVKAGPLPETLKQEFLRWRENGGLAHLLQYLQNIDLTGFDPKGRAPITDAKRDMVEASRSDLDRWALDVASGSLPVGKEVATADELTRRFLMEYPHLRTAPSVATVAKVLVRMGAYRRDNQVRLSDGRKVRALALVRIDHWKGQPEMAWRTELEKRS